MKSDFLVVGAGVAGLRAAIELAPAGGVLVVAKDRLHESSSEYAQGGIAVALSDDDDIELHEQDTIDRRRRLVRPEGRACAGGARAGRDSGTDRVGRGVRPRGIEAGVRARGRAQPQPRAARARRFDGPRDCADAVRKSVFPAPSPISELRWRDRPAGEGRRGCGRDGLGRNRPADW